MAKKSPTKAELQAQNQVDFEKNYASDPDMCEKFLAYVQEPMQTARNNRQHMERIWLDDYRLWACVLDEKGYQGMSNLFVGELNNQVESSVEKGLTAMFPAGDNFFCVPMRDTDQDEADKIKQAVAYELNEKSQLEIKYDLHLRQKIIYGTSVMRGSFLKDMVKIFVNEKKSSGKLTPTARWIPRYHGVKWEPVDMFHWYLYPEKACIETAQVIFEDTIFNRAKAERSGLYVNLEELPGLSSEFDNDWVDLERLDIDKLSSAIKRYDKGFLMTEVYCEFPLMGDTPIPVRAILANKTTVIRLTANPFWFQTPPYQGSKYVERPGGSFYGMSLPDKIRSQQYQMNDVANQTQDSLNYSLNPMMIVDPALAGDVNSMKTRPGARWLGSKDGIMPISFPDVSQSGLQTMQEIRGQIAQFSDNTPGIAPQLQGKARSATQASIVQSSVGARQRIQAKSEEFSVLGPICKKTHIMLQQYMDDEYWIRVQGPDAGSWISKVVKPEDLVGDVDFIWKGQTEAEKTAAYAQQLLSLYQAALQTQSIMPGEIDLPALFKRVAKEAWGIQDMDQIFSSLRKAKTVDPESENIALLQEMEVDTNNGDNDDQHMRTHELALDKATSDEAKLAILRHLEKHEVQKKGKQDLQTAQAKLQAVQALSQAPGMGVQGQPPGGMPQQQQDGRMGPQPPGLMEGNQSQAPASTGDALSGVRPS